MFTIIVNTRKWGRYHEAPIIYALGEERGAHHSIRRRTAIGRASLLCLAGIPASAALASGNMARVQGISKGR